MKRIKLAFSDVWFDPVRDRDDQDIFNIIKEAGIDYELSDAPDFLIYGPHGYEYLKYDCPRIYWTGENVSPDFSECDYAVGFDYMDYGDRYIRYPFYMMYRKAYERCLNRTDAMLGELFDREFCACVISNAASEDRNAFLESMEKCGNIAYGGRYKNNVGGRVKDKLDFQRGYKFSIAFENSRFPGYVTEKIVEAFASNTVPIYSGDPLIGREFNPRAFINVDEYATFDEAVDYIRKVNSDERLYMDMLREPIFAEKYHDTRNDVIEFVHNILYQDKEKAYRRNRSTALTNRDKENYIIHRFSRSRSYKIVMRLAK